MIDRMLQEDFARYVASDLNRPITDQELLHEEVTLSGLGRMRRNLTNLNINLASFFFLNSDNVVYISLVLYLTGGGNSVRAQEVQTESYQKCLFSLFSLLHFKG